MMNRPRPDRASVLLTFFMASAALLASGAAAQQASDSATGQPGGSPPPVGGAAPGGIVPGGAVPGGPLQGGLMPGGGQGSALAPAAVVPSGTATGSGDPGLGDAGPTTGPALPEGFVPPSTKPAIMTEMPDPRRSEKEMKAAERKIRGSTGGGVRRMVLSGVPSQENRQVLELWARLRVDRLRAAETTLKIQQLTKETLQLLQTAASLQTNPNRAREFRTMMCEILAEELQGTQKRDGILLKSNLYVRLSAVALLMNMNIREASPRENLEEIAFTPAIAPLLDAIEHKATDPQTAYALRSVKIAAAEGIKRLARNSDSIDTQLQYRAADVLSKALLSDPNAYFWYQASLAEALAAIGLDLDSRRNPVVVNTLMTVITDERRHCEARAVAAKALSRTPIPANKFDEDAAAQAILALGREFALSYNKTPQDSHWRYCFWYLHLAFEVGPREDSDKLAEDSLLRSGSLPPSYQTAHRRLKPVLDVVLTQPINSANPSPIPVELLQPLRRPLERTATTATE